MNILYAPNVEAKTPTSMGRPTSAPTARMNEASDETPICKDSNGTPLNDGDAVTVIKDLKVRGSSMVIKQGTKVKTIRLTENPEEVEGKVDGSMMVLRAEFLKKG